LGKLRQFHIDAEGEDGEGKTEHDRSERGGGNKNQNMKKGGGGWKGNDDGSIGKLTPIETILTKDPN